MSAIKRHSPTELRGNVPPLTAMLVDGRIFWELFGFGLCSLGGFAGLRDSHTYVWVCFSAAVLGPLIAASVFLFFPIQPYRSWQAQASGMQNKDRRDPEAQRVVELFASPAVRRFTLQTALKLALILLPVTAVVSAFLWGRPSRSLHSPITINNNLFLPVYFLYAVGSFAILKVEILAWAFRNWGNFQRGEGPFHVGKWRSVRDTSSW
jgi:hypothetical protein